MRDSTILGLPSIPADAIDAIDEGFEAFDDDTPPQSELSQTSQLPGRRAAPRSRPKSSGGSEEPAPILDQEADARPRPQKAPPKAPASAAPGSLQAPLAAGSARSGQATDTTTGPLPRSDGLVMPPPPAGEGGLPALELSADADSLFTSLHGFLSQELDYIPDEDARTRARLLYELGQIEEIVFRDAARARPRYQRANEVDGAFVPALRAQRRFYSATGKWEEARDCLTREVEVTPREQQRAALLEVLAQLKWHRLSDSKSSVENLEQALALSPRQRRGLELMREIFSREGRHAELFSALGKLSNITSDDLERAHLTTQMAELAEFRLNQAQRAEELYAHALKLDPNNEKAAVALRRLYLAHERWEQLNELLTVEVGREHEPDEMFADMYRAARICEVHLNDDERAASLLETAAALRPGDVLPLTALTEVYQRAGRHDELASVFKRHLRLTRDPEARADLFYRSGRLYDDWLSRPEDAVDALAEALRQRPDHEPSLSALVALYERLERWAELKDLELLRAERRKEVEARAEGYMRAAELCERQLDQQGRAAELYRRAWKLRPGLPNAFVALDRIYREQKKWDALVDLYLQRVDLTKDSALAASLLRATAVLQEEKLEDRRRAIATLERLRIEHPEDREALVHLARLYDAVGRADDLRRTLQEWADVTDDPAERIELTRRIGDLFDGPLRNSEAAIATYREILRDVADERVTRLRLEMVLERLGRWDELLGLLESGLDIEPSAPAQARIQLRMGHVYEDKLGLLDEAQAAYDRSLELDPDFVPARLALEELLRRQARWGPLSELLVKQAELAKDAPGAGALLCRAAEIHEEFLGQPEHAERLFTRALELDRSAGPARQGLERLYLASEDHEALQGHYLREAEGAANPVLRVRAYLRLAALYDGVLDDTARAATAYESALKVVADQPDALHALTALCRRTESWDRLFALLPRIAATAQDRDAAVAALKEWASLVELYRSERWDPEPIYRRVLDGDPKDAHALAALDALAFRKGNDQALLELALKQARNASDPELAASLCLRAAAIVVTAGKPSEAAEVLRRGLRDQPDYLPLIRMLRRLDEQQETWEEAAHLLLREGELVRCTDVRHQALVRAGNILLDRFDDVQGAADALLRVFDEDPQHGAAFGRLAEILASQDRWNDLVDLYHRRMAAVDGTARVPLQLQLATILEDRLSDVEGAVDVLTELLASEPTNARALEQIARLCVEQERWREAEDFLARLAEVSTENPERQRHTLLQRSEILANELGDTDAALAVLRELLVHQPSDRDALERCMAIYQHRGEWERVVEMLKQLGRSGSFEERVKATVDLAEIFARNLADGEQAQAALSRAATLAVESGTGIDIVTRYFERRGDFEGLVALWGGALERLPPEGSPGAVAVRLARSRLLAGRLLRPGEAEQEIRKALKGAPDSLPARLELAGLHLWGDNLAEAVSEYARVLELAPYEPAAFRGLYRVHERRGDMDRAAMAAQAIGAVGDPDEAEGKIADQALMVAERALSGAISTPLTLEGYWQLLAHGDEPAEARELLYALADYLPVVFEAELSDSKGIVIPLDPRDQIVGRCQLCARVLGVDEVDYAVGQKIAQPVMVLAAAKPRVVVEESFAANASDGRFRFWVGRALARVLCRSFYLDQLSPARIELLLASAVELYDRGYASYLGRQPEVDDLTKRLTRAIPRRVRKGRLEELARAYGARGENININRWLERAQRGANRAGLLLCGDVRVAVKELERSKASGSFRSKLLRFSVGPHFSEARRRLGLAI
jgi:tetratricopeptide (TPR) repeat protein